MCLEALNMLDSDVKRSNSVHEPSSNEGSNDYNFSANELSTSKTMAKHMVFDVHKCMEVAMEMRCYCKILCISYKEHVTNKEVHAKIQQAIVSKTS